MYRLGILFLLVVSALNGWAWWIFGSDDDEPRLSKLMEPASILIDEAVDLAADGKTNEAVEAYRKALDKLNQIEYENPERSKTPEFATLRNKRAYISAAIDSLLMAQAQDNAKAVSVTDTRELEKKFNERRGIVKREPPMTPKVKTQQKSTTLEEVTKALASKPNDRKLIVKATQLYINKGNYTEARRMIVKLLLENPEDVTALNLKALCESEAGDLSAALRALQEAIKVKPNDYYAYYNMATLILKAKGKVSDAEKYYAMGRSLGGPVDKALEEALK